MFFFQSSIAAVAMANLAIAVPQSRPRTACDQSAATTKSNYTVQASDTIFSIANKTGSGACDIARFNKMADAEMLTTGMTILIPEQLCDPDNTSCILENDEPLSDCILGGPHTYTTVLDDTVAKIALYKFHLTVAALESTLQSTMNESSIIEAGSSFKMPQCTPSQCVVQPYHFTYGTYKDLAAKAGSSVGQIFAFNPTYNISTDGPGTGPVLTIPFNCTALSSNVTVES